MDSEMEFDAAAGVDRPVVAIRGRWAWLVFLSPFVVVGLNVLALWPSHNTVHPAGEPWWIRHGQWILFVVILTGTILVLVPFMRAALLVPAFAVFKHGIKIPLSCRTSDRAVWDPLAYGFVEWRYVRWCRWSPYDLGLLSIQLESIPWRTWPKWLSKRPFSMKVPSMLVQYRVPEAYRERVEAAIRAFGKWGS